MLTPHRGIARAHGTDCASASYAYITQGYCTERIFRTALAAKLREESFLCHEEVVLPVLCENSYVGHNRLDILLEEVGTGVGKHVVALELKCLTGTLASDRMGPSAVRQAQGYLKCLKHVFPDAKSLTVFIVNLSKDTQKPEVRMVKPVDKNAWARPRKHLKRHFKTCNTNRKSKRLSQKS